MLFDLFNSLACRSAKRSIFYLGLFSNRMYNYACAFCIIGQLLVIYAPFLQAVFKTEALSLADLLKLTVLASSVLWIDEIRKYRERRLAVSTGSPRGKAANHSDEDHASLLV